MNIPILFLTFNRPDTTQRVFHNIREARPPRLYIAADGPRKDREGEADKCEQVRQVATDVDWDCEVNTLFREENMGCKIAVSGAIDWFFKNEEMGIILEDDCLPNQSFFRFCDELLHKYRNEEQVMTISGNNFQPKRRTENSYYFSKYMHCWGWATWRRAWEHFDLEMRDWPELKKSDFLGELLNAKKAQRYWEDIFDQVYDNKIDSWAYIWSYSIWKTGGINILPELNLVSNIGFDSGGTHTSESDSQFANMNTYKLNWPLVHPESIEVNKQADRWTQRHHFQTPFPEKVINKIRNIF